MRISTAPLAALLTSLGAQAAPQTLAGSRPPMATAGSDAGRMSPDAMVHGPALIFGRTARQQADLASLIQAQHDPSSPLYHRWLTPEQFAERFGPADADIAAAASWLEARGLTIDGLSRSRDRLRFSGTASRIGAAFGTELHHYRTARGLAFAPASDLTVPAALAGAVRAVGNLHSFRPQPRIAPRPAFTSAQTGNHYFSPGDIATIYDLNPAYAAGFDGSGQSIAVVGQSAIDVADVETFQHAAGVRVHDPVLVLVPGTGDPTQISGDFAEGDLDVEYTSSIAPGAIVYYVFTGSNQNFSAFDSLQFVVDNNLARIISSSYGLCESALSSSDYAGLESILSQAASQGQSLIAATGDTGSTDCANVNGLPVPVRQGLAVDYPASSEFSTGIGGTEVTAAAVSSDTFWTRASGNDVISSATSYIPEQVWNDDVAAQGIFSSGGGGTSALTARPPWQTGVPGIPNGSNRLVPDISLAASPENVGFLFCSGDVLQTGVNGSCSNGFRDIDNTFLTVAGGTSFAAPIFAGMVAVLEQKLSAGGQGVIASTLYGIAANPSKYASAFHDIIFGGNQCLAGPSKCTTVTQSSFAAGPGYDQASGLGSIDFANLMAAWPPVPPTASRSQVSISAADSSPLGDTNDLVTVNVTPASASGTAITTGSVLISVDGSPVSATLALSGGVATYVFSSSTGGVHTESISATYVGDAQHDSSQATLPLNVRGKTFSVSAHDATVAAGGSGTSVMTVTPQNGYGTGTIGWTVASIPALSQGCFSIPETPVNGTAPFQVQLTIDAAAAVCGTAGLAVPGHGQLASRSPWRTGGAALLGLTFAGLLGSGVLRRRRWIGLLVVAAGAAGVVACGTSTTSPTAQIIKGTYTLTLTGSDTNNLSITGSTTMKLTIN
jgi:hypothetical protein